MWFIVCLFMVWVGVLVFAYLYDARGEKENAKYEEAKQEKLLCELGCCTTAIVEERKKLSSHRSLQARVVSHTAGSLELKLQITKSEQKIKDIQSRIREIEKELM